MDLPEGSLARFIALYTNTSRASNLIDLLNTINTQANIRNHIKGVLFHKRDWMAEGNYLIKVKELVGSSYITLKALFNCDVEIITIRSPNSEILHPF